MMPSKSNGLLKRWLIIVCSSYAVHPIYANSEIKFCHAAHLDRQHTPHAHISHDSGRKFQETKETQFRPNDQKVPCHRVGKAKA